MFSFQPQRKRSSRLNLQLLFHYPKVKFIRTIKIILLLIIYSSLHSCSDKSQFQIHGFQIKDDAGVEVNFDTLPKRIISLAPNITEALFAIGADSLVVGVTNYCDYPPEVKNKVKTGSYLSPDYEAMTSLNPDLIIMNVESTSQPTYQAIKNLKTKIFVSNARNIDGIIKMLKDLGKITGNDAKAKDVAEMIFTKRQNYLTLNKDLVKKKALIVISVNPLMTANANTFINEIADLSGFENIYKDQSIDYPLISYEDITGKNPAFIILPTDTNKEMNYTRYINELSDKLNTSDAVKEKQIILVDENIMFRPGPRVLEGVKLLRDKLNKF